MHKLNAVRQAIVDVGTTVIDLPTYSPELNPIEMVWADMNGEVAGAFERHIRSWVVVQREVTSRPSSAGAAPATCVAGWTVDCTRSATSTSSLRVSASSSRLSNR